MLATGTEPRRTVLIVDGVHLPALYQRNLDTNLITSASTSATAILRYTATLEVFSPDSSTLLAYQPTHSPTGIMIYERGEKVNKNCSDDTTLNKDRTYLPDFFLPHYSIYLDVKNPFKQTQDKDKLNQLQNLIPLIVGDLKTIIQYIETL